MNNKTFKHIAMNELWRDNAILVHCLALCPLLVMSSSLAKALGLGLITLVILLLSSLLIALLRPAISASFRLVFYVFISGSLVSIAQLLMQAFAPQWAKLLGIFLPLIAVNGLLLMQAEYNAERAAKTSVIHSLFAGLGFLLLLMLMGFIRELLGTGQLFADMHHLFGPQATAWQITIWKNHPGFLSLGLAPGAFIVFALLLAAKNVFDSKTTKHDATKVDTESRRIRVTGRLA